MSVLDLQGPTLVATLREPVEAGNMGDARERRRWHVEPNRLPAWPETVFPTEHQSSRRPCHQELILCYRDRWLCGNTANGTLTSSAAVFCGRYESRISPWRRSDENKIRRGLALVFCASRHFDITLLLLHLPICSWKLRAPSHPHPPRPSGRFKVCSTSKR